jgi:hypothetical protein
MCYISIALGSSHAYDHDPAAEDLRLALLPPERAGTTAHSFILEAIAERRIRQNAARTHDIADKRYAALWLPSRQFPGRKPILKIESREKPSRPVAKPAR